MGYVHFFQFHTIRHVDNAVDAILSNDCNNKDSPKELVSKQNNTSDEKTENSSDESTNDQIEIQSDDSISDEQWRQLYEKQSDYTINSPTTPYNTPPKKTDYSCRCGSTFENQSDLNDHVMNSSYCYDFYMYHDNQLIN